MNLVLPQRRTAVAEDRAAARSARPSGPGGPPPGADGGPRGGHGERGLLVNLALVKGLDRRVGGLACRLLSAWDGVRAWFAPEPSPLADVRRIVVVKLWGIGNWALLRPIVRDLRDRWPGASVSVVTLAANEPLVRDLADRVHLLRADGLLRLTRDLVRCVVALRRERADLCVDFEQFSTAGVLLARCAGVAAARRVRERGPRPRRVPVGGRAVPPRRARLALVPRPRGGGRRAARRVRGRRTRAERRRARRGARAARTGSADAPPGRRATRRRAPSSCSTRARATTSPGGAGRPPASPPSLGTRGPATGRASS